jgi:uncharacterized membrane protein YdbT with pleckstrin-like domain
VLVGASVKAILGALWAVTIALSGAILVDYARDWRKDKRGIMPRHVLVIATAYVLLATVAVWGIRREWETMTTGVGLTLGVVALGIVLRREWSR